MNLDITSIRQIIEECANTPLQEAKTHRAIFSALGKRDLGKITTRSIREYLRHAWISAGKPKNLYDIRDVLARAGVDETVLGKVFSQYTMQQTAPTQTGTSAPNTQTTITAQTPTGHGKQKNPKQTQPMQTSATAGKPNTIADSSASITTPTQTPTIQQPTAVPDGSSGTTTTSIDAHGANAPGNPTISQNNDPDDTTPLQDSNMQDLANIAAGLGFGSEELGDIANGDLGLVNSDIDPSKFGVSAGSFFVPFIVKNGNVSSDFADVDNTTFPDMQGAISYADTILGSIDADGIATLADGSTVQLPSQSEDPKLKESTDVALEYTKSGFEVGKSVRVYSFLFNGDPKLPILKVTIGAKGQTISSVLANMNRSIKKDYADEKVISRVLYQSNNPDLAALVKIKDDKERLSRVKAAISGIMGDRVEKVGDSFVVHVKDSDGSETKRYVYTDKPEIRDSVLSAMRGASSTEKKQ